MTEQWNWPPDRLYKSLCVVLDENDDLPPVLRGHIKRRLNNLRRRGKLTLMNLDSEWVWRLCVAELLQRRYHWFGWEKRSDFAWELSTKPWFYPRWDGKPCALRAISEQGIGDEILFASCYPDLLADCPRATIEVDDRLLPVMVRSLGANFVDRWGHYGRGVGRPNSDYRGEHDAFIPCGNVPKLYRGARTDFPGQPYLIADTERVWQMQEWLARYPKPWIGVSWKGGGNREMDAGDLIEGRGTHVNLQYNDTDPRLVQPSIDLRDDVDGVFALVAALDHVNCVPVWVLHVAGSMGIPVNLVRAPKQYGDRNNILRWEFGRWHGRMDWYRSVTMWGSVQLWRDHVKKQTRQALRELRATG